MKVLFLSHQADFIFGGEICTLSLMRELKQAGVDVHFASPPGEYHERAKAVAKCHLVPSIQFSRKVHMLPRLLPALIRTDRALRQLVKREQIDIVHATSLKAMVYAWRLSRKLPVIWHHHDIMPSHFRNDLWVRALAKRAALVLTPSEATKAALEAADVPEKKVRVLRNGFDCGEWRIRPSRRDGGKLRVAMIGEISRRKGSDLLPALADALAHEGNTASNVELLVVGKALSEPDLETELKNALSARQWVKFLGRREDVRDLLQEIDVLLVPSRQDPLPTVIVEAQLSGVPCIGTRVGGIPEMIEHKANGYLIQSISEVPAALAELTNVDVWNRFSAASRSAAEKNYDSKKIASETMKIYGGLLG